MFTFIAVCIFIVCILLILIVLVQNSKGGGLASTFAGSNQIMGVKKTGDFLERATWALAVILFVLCLASAAVIPNVQEQENIENIGDKMQDKVEKTPVLPTTPKAEENTTDKK
ncbi:MAG: preprotein translocase subunit SecG [Flavobacteriaceae bacterium]|nr:preprotein translocase subunit SecG [Flavobacteriaceae bacterium]